MGSWRFFTTALEAVQATIQAQTRLQTPLADLKINVRMGVHTGEAELREGDYYGQSLNRTARIMAVGYGGQDPAFRGDRRPGARSNCRQTLQSRTWANTG